MMLNSIHCGMVECCTFRGKDKTFSEARQKKSKRKSTKLCYARILLFSISLKSCQMFGKNLNVNQLEPI